MPWDVIIPILIAVLYFGVLFYGIWKGSRSDKRDQKYLKTLDKDLAVIVKMLLENENVPKELIEKVASNPILRGQLFANLSSRKKEFLFPAEYLSDESKVEAYFYFILRQQLGDIEVSDFSIKQKIEKKLPVKNEEVEVLYFLGTFNLVSENSEQVFVIGPQLPYRYEFPMGMLTSIEIGYSPEFSELVNMAQKKYLLKKAQ